MSLLEKRSQLIIDECSRLEPCDAEVCADETQETKVVFENTDFSVAADSSAILFGLRVVSKNRLGFITTNSSDEKTLKEKAREAQQLANLSPESPFHAIAPKQEISGVFEISDEKLKNTKPKELLKWIELLVNESKKDPRVALDRAEISLSSFSRVIMNSKGVLQKVSQTTCSWFVMGMAKDKEEVTSFDYDGNTASSIDGIEQAITKTANDFSHSVISSLGARHAKSYSGPVLFHPDAVGSLIAGLISFNVNARAQQDGMSQWAKKIDTLVATNDFTITENPHDESRPAGWTPFDREGVITKNRAIIENGTLKFSAHNSFTAKRGNTESTGNASGGARSLPSIGLNNLTIKGGSTPESDLFKKLNSGLLLKRFSGNSDPVSGQFSGIAKNSFWVENGQIAYPIKEVMISGNMFELLKNIKAIGSTVHRQMGSFESPYLLIDGLSITSA